MNYQNVFAKTYFQKQDDRACEDQGRNPKKCPATEVINRILKKVYGQDLERSKCECSMSLVSRPDPFFGIFKERSTRQVFLFDKYFPFDNSHSIVGTLDVRCPSEKELSDIPTANPWASAVWCAMGYLIPPRYMTMDGGYVLPLLDFYSIHGGLLPFLCTPYISHHRFFGYVCVQAAVYLTLEMTLRLQSSPHSPATISHIVSEEAYNHVTHELDEHFASYCQEHHPADRNFPNSKGFYFRGLSSTELERLLDSPHLNTRSLTLHLSGKDKEDFKERVILHLQSMLCSRIPVIALVDYNTLVTTLGGKPSETNDAHVITIIGYRVPSKARDFRIVFHDGQLGPYQELDIEIFMKAALEGSKQKKDIKDMPQSNEGAVRLYSAIPRNVNSIGYVNLFDSARSVLDNEDFDCVIQLCSLSQLLKYLSKYAPCKEIKIHIDDGQETQIKKLAHLTRLHEEDLIWIVEYSHLIHTTGYNKKNSTDVEKKQNELNDEPFLQEQRQKRQRILLDLFHVGDSINQRVGVIILELGYCPGEEGWRFLAVSDEKKDRRRNPILEKNFETGCKKYSITYH